MLGSFGSLSLPATTAIVTIASMLTVLALSRSLHNRWLWVAAVVAPLAIAYCIYWMPVWVDGGDPAQASAWELLVMIAWGGSGTVACMILVAFLRMRRPKVR
ncbi:hypothetical protein LVB87_03315 [Lysobacter sp. KIS68-7]|uniref:hypothetical protein n=1 Tax=Lysobacter sp. KIS68-7 TaxID=2904252 RepID=UPI001E4E08FE|nr:hypothetical protein [Lysobacter sp. KIS68-7]UHQ20205.1 hypothetical protein LVB87_03315 [Lysobacter sp. KIS68-7]